MRNLKGGYGPVTQLTVALAVAAGLYLPSMPPRAFAQQAPAIAAASSDGAVAQTLTSISVRTGLHPTFGRIVFDWTCRVGYEVKVEDNALTIVFQEPVTIDVTDVPVRLGRYVAAAAVETGNGRTAAGFTVKADARIRHCYVGNRVVIDIYESADAAARAAGRQPIADIATLVGESLPPASAPPTPALPEGPAPPVQIQPDGSGASRTTAPAAAGGLPSLLPDLQAGTGSTEASGVTITTTPADRGVIIDFDWGGNAPAAVVFEAYDAIWIAFDRPANVVIESLTGPSAGQIERVLVVGNPDRALVLRLDTWPGLRPHVRRYEGIWRVRLLEGAPLPDKPLTVAGGTTSGLVVDGSDGAAPLNVTDPVSGIRMILVPIRASSRGVVLARQFVPFELLATAQGIAIRPRPDALPVASRRDGVEIGGSGGLPISAEALAPAALPPCRRPQCRRPIQRRPG